MQITKVMIKTKRYAATPSSAFPAVLDPEGCYPYTQFSETAAAGDLIELEAFELENDLLVATVCPSLGGRMLSLYDKVAGKESLYRNDVIKPNRILPRWGWFSGGIEFNFPIAHSPTSLELVGHRLFETEGRIAIQVGETERKYGLSWIVELSLGENEDFITQRFFIRNPGDIRRPYCLWNNAAVRSTPETKYLYPAAKVFRHAHVADWVQWPDIGEREKDFDRMTGLFWEARGNAFGVWHPEESTGLLHIADPTIYPGMKMWTYGVGKHASWPGLFTDDGRPYAEIQSGAMHDQNTELFLAPGEEHAFTCFWKPLQEEVDISAVDVPEPVGTFPPCEWIGNSHIAELAPWNELKTHYTDEAQVQARDLFGAAPEAPPPPLPEYEAPLRAACEANPAAWREHLATYLCAMGEYGELYLAETPDYEEILAMLDTPRTASEHRVRGLVLWRKLQRPEEAAIELKKAQERTGDLQVALELDTCLADMGDTEGRKTLFDAVVSEDKRWIERRVDLLLQLGQATEARALLLATTWDLYHLRHVRGDLYKRCQAALGESEQPIPDSLGEDDMCEWGAYRPQATKS